MNENNEETPGVSGNSSEGIDQNHLESESIKDNFTDVEDSLPKYAQLYGWMGWKVFPVHGLNEDDNCTCGQSHDKDEDDKKKKAKHPAIREWNLLATNDHEQIDKWWEENPNYNIGVVCNESDLVVIDVDPRNGGLDSLEIIEESLNISFPPTLQSVTGEYVLGDEPKRGWHFFYKDPGGTSFRANLNSGKPLGHLPGIDIKHKGYVILPPSRHASGVSYEWCEYKKPREMPIAEVSDELLGLISKGPEREYGVYELLSENEIDEIRQEAQETTTYGRTALKDELDKVSATREGGRNNQLFASAIGIAELIAGGHISWDDGVPGLQAAANECGLTEAETSQVLFRQDGALVRGLSNPRGPQPLSDEILQWAKRMSNPQATQLTEPSTIRELANIVDWHEMFSGPPVEEEWLVPGIICAERGHSLYSDAGLGKSLVMREIGACLAAGKSALGNPPKEPMTVLYLDYENNPYGDVTKSLQDMGFTEADLTNFVVASFPEFEKFDTKKGGQQLKALVEEIQPRLVIIDTLSRVVEGDENSNDTWLKFFNYVGQELKKAKIAYVRLDHEGQNASNGARGGSAKKGDIDFVWHYTQVLKKKKFKLTNEKSRTFIETEVFMITRHTEPQLHHLVEAVAKSDENSWSALIERNKKFVETCELINNHFDTDKKIPGQKAAWEKLQSKCQQRSISREMLNDAIKALKTPYFSVEQEEELEILE